jgi:bifunctional DNA-binding transcriptional regulator/antitoxin component of YhaV-PrlF toxin-antitoxin module
MGSIKNAYEIRKVQGLESSVGITLPKRYSMNLGIAKGSLVKVCMDGRRRIILEKVDLDWKKSDRKYAIESKEVETGKAAQPIQTQPIYHSSDQVTATSECDIA